MEPSEPTRSVAWAASHVYSSSVRPWSEATERSAATISGSGVGSAGASANAWTPNAAGLGKAGLG
ncbi:hypothetical protein [Edaphobacter aggregans]|uniref:hypothetical protein n=1 Tax=Edaphobacter aggregans TaxID=570835 RepID=UPI0021ADCBEA|nr:hypothetical protein [Edaphobacter aggregans]